MNRLKTRVATIRRKAAFYSALYGSYLLGRLDCRREFIDIPKLNVPDDVLFEKKRLRVRFWTPNFTPGAIFLVHRMIPVMRERLGAMGLDWDVDWGKTLPDSPVDVLICFKAVPDRTALAGNPRVVLLICDQAELFFGEFGVFDDVVVTSSHALASLIARRHPRVWFIDEGEPVENTNFGKVNLDGNLPSLRPMGVMWHGTLATRRTLDGVRDILEHAAQERPLQCFIVSGKEPQSEETWGNCRVVRMPWSLDNMMEAARRSRFGLLPALESLRSGYLKPAARVRCLFSLGVPALGDASVPEVAAFSEKMFRITGVRIAMGPKKEWRDAVSRFLADERALDRLARAGYEVVAGEYSARNTALQWIWFLGVYCRSEQSV